MTTWPEDRPEGACLLWAHDEAGCPTGRGQSALVARTGAECVATDMGPTADQTFAVAAGNGTFNVTMYQYDPVVGGCDPMLDLPLLAAGTCYAMANWWAAYALLDCV